MGRNDEEMAEEDPRAGRRMRVIVRALVIAGLAILLLVVGAAGGLVWSKRRASSDATAVATASRKPASEPNAGSASPGGTSMPGMPGMGAAAKSDKAAGAAKGDEPVEVSLTTDAVERAGIKTAVVRSEVSTSTLTVPGTVTSNAYRDTKVNSLVGGVVRRVAVELGSDVKRGEPLAVVFSAELAEAQMKYLSMQAMLLADHQKRVRTEKLVALGAASRQELEEVTAVHAGHETEVAAARQRLLLLGLSEEQVAKVKDASHVVSEVTVRAPADGVVITRTVNPGQVITAGQELFVVADLSSVWAIGDVYEKDFASVRVGAGATVTIPSAPGREVRGRVAYIDPRVDPATRTAKVRVEVPNRNMDLRLGMYVTIGFQTGSGERLTLVPRSAVQSIGDRMVVYVPADDEGRFVERSVKLGPALGDSIQVLEGLKPGEKVVTDGSFFLRAEAGRTRSGG